VDGNRLHEVCVKIARARPYNSQCLHRVNAALGGCWPCSYTSSVDIGAMERGPELRVVSAVKPMASSGFGRKGRPESQSLLGEVRL